MATDDRPTAVLVGASGGIGAALAAELGTSHTLWLVGRDEGRLRRAASDAPHAQLWPVDLERTADGVEVPADLVAVDLLVLGAGAWAHGTVENSSPTLWERTFAVNVFGQVALTRALLPQLRAARGRVVVLNSTVLMGARGSHGVYAASKAALRVFAEALHEEERANGVSVTSIYLGRVATAMQREVASSEGGTYAPELYLGPDTVARTIGFIARLGPEAHVADLVVRPPFPAAR